MGLRRLENFASFRIACASHCAIPIYFYHFQPLSVDYSISSVYLPYSLCFFAFLGGPEMFFDYSLSFARLLHARPSPVLDVVMDQNVTFFISENRSAHF
jgi:hypothetical protein